MSKLQQPNGDDYPAAARKHLKDSAALLAQGRSDGSAYLSGYVVECALKTLLQLEQGRAPWTHALEDLAKHVASLTARADVVVGRRCVVVAALLKQADILKWRPGMRYCDEATPGQDAATWHREAGDVYSKVIGALFLDGRI